MAVDKDPKVRLAKARKAKGGEKPDSKEGFSRAAKSASKEAHEASMRANVGGIERHADAAAAHKHAAILHLSAGNIKEATEHAGHALNHEKRAAGAGESGGERSKALAPVLDKLGVEKPEDPKARLAAARKEGVAGEGEQKSISALQHVSTHKTEEEANQAHEAMKKQDGYLGGRVTPPSPGKPDWHAQTFHQDSPNMKESEMPEGMRRVTLLSGQHAALGIKQEAPVFKANAGKEMEKALSPKAAAESASTKAHEAADALRAKYGHENENPHVAKAFDKYLEANDKNAHLGEDAAHEAGMKAAHEHMANADAADTTRRLNSQMDEMKRTGSITPRAAPGLDPKARLAAARKAAMSPKAQNTGKRGGIYFITPTGRRIYLKR